LTLLAAQLTQGIYLLGPPQGRVEEVLSYDLAYTKDGKYLLDVSSGARYPAPEHVLDMLKNRRVAVRGATLLAAKPQGTLEGDAATLTTIVARRCSN
jgi:hypothetical protein